MSSSRLAAKIRHSPLRACAAKSYCWFSVPVLHLTSLDSWVCEAVVTTVTFSVLVRLALVQDKLTSLEAEWPALEKQLQLVTDFRCVQWH